MSLMTDLSSTGLGSIKGIISSPFTASAAPFPNVSSILLSSFTDRALFENMSRKSSCPFTSRRSLVVSPLLSVPLFWSLASLFISATAAVAIFAELSIASWYASRAFWYSSLSSAFLSASTASGWLALVSGSSVLPKIAAVLPRTAVSRPLICMARLSMPRLFMVATMSSDAGPCTAKPAFSDSSSIDSLLKASAFSFMALIVSSTPLFCFPISCMRRVISGDSDCKTAISSFMSRSVFAKDATDSS